MFLESKKTLTKESQKNLIHPPRPTLLLETDLDIDQNTPDSHKHGRHAAQTPLESTPPCSDGVDHRPVQTALPWATLYARASKHLLVGERIEIPPR